MDCQACSEEIPEDSIFCPECGARQDLSKGGGRSFGVVTPQAVQSGNTDEEGANQAQPMDVDTLNRLAFQMNQRGSGESTNQPTPPANDISAAFSELFLVSKYATILDPDPVILTIFTLGKFCINSFNFFNLGYFLKTIPSKSLSNLLILLIFKIFFVFFIN